MAYCPLAHSESYRKTIIESKEIQEVAQRHNASIFQIMLAFVARVPNAIALPKSASVAHVQHNLEGLTVHLSEEDLKQIDSAFPPPTQKAELDML